MILDDQASNLFNLILSDVEWQNGLKSWQYDVALQFAHSWILSARANDADVTQEYLDMREALRYLANRVNGRDHKS